MATKEEIRELLRQEIVPLKLEIGQISKSLDDLLFQQFQDNRGVCIEIVLLLAWQLHSQFSWTHGCHS